MSTLPKIRNSAMYLWWFVPIVAIGGWFFPYLGLFVIACMFAPVLVAIKRGRHWCGWLCPRGALFDGVMSRISPKRKIPAVMRSKGFRLGAMLVLMGMMVVQLILAWPDPAAMSRVFVLLLGVTTLAGIILSLVYRPRTWCSFCPMGTMANWLSHGKRPLSISESCRNCNACARVCPMSLTPQTVDATHADCLKCNRCVEKCPHQSISF